MSDDDPQKLAGYFASTDFDDFKRRFDADAFHRLLGITLVERGDGTARIRLATGERTPRGIGADTNATNAVPASMACCDVSHAPAWTEPLFV